MCPRHTQHRYTAPLHSTTTQHHYTARRCVQARSHDEYGAVHVSIFVRVGESDSTAAEVPMRQLCVGSMRDVGCGARTAGKKAAKKSKAEEQKSRRVGGGRRAEEQKSRRAEEQVGAEEQKSRRAEEQKSRRAEEQKSRWEQKEASRPGIVPGSPA
ncbi:hypothetical protein P3T76_016419 [Phytophthora citrophthora]|uniref:Uncharacterized protein n=1 Tax=Phytophthora citrophthora TaxID=4793 RepID=A0AAD9FY06_9STRA|nr:hypothetical protein P3T76_016419 [Phytophthora citrophthora]